MVTDVSKKKILISGGTGYLGRNIIDKLDDKYEFINIGRNQNSLCENIQWNSEGTVVVNEKIDTVIHSAAIIGDSRESLSEYINVNIKFTSQLLDYCLKNKVENFIYISSGGVYGYKETPFKETDQCNPQGIYNLSKKFSEDLSLLCSEKMRIVIYRPFFPFGPNQKGRLFDNLITSIMKNKSVKLNLGGGPIINPICIEDFIEIVDQEIVGKNEGIFNLAGVECMSIKDIVEKISEKLQIENLEYKYVDNKVENLIGDNSKLKEATNYNYKISFSEAIDKVIYKYL